MRSQPPDLRAFLAALRASGELVHVQAEVDPWLEAAEIHRRVIAAGGPALFFERVRGCDFPLVSNLFGTRARVERAFGTRPVELVSELARLPAEILPPSWSKLWSKRALLGSLLRVGTAARGRAPILEVVESPPRLARLPAWKTWPRDGGRFLTLPLVLTRHPETAVTNLGVYRVQLYDEPTGGTQTGLHMQIGKGGGFHLAASERLGRALPVNIFVGGPPALMLAAIAPLPENVPELMLASLLLQRRIALAKSPAGPLPLLADAEFALVGEVAPGARRAEGPFGDHYGYYSETHDYPLFTCRALCRRREPIFTATVVGKPRQEDFFLGDYVQELLSPLFPLAMPAVRRLWSYGETGFHSLAAAIVRESYKREAMTSAFRILGEGQLALTKFLLVTDSEVELRDFRATLTHVLARADFATDLFVFANLSMDSLDYAGPRINEGGKGVLLGLGPPRRKLPSEFTGSPPPQVTRACVFSPGCLVLQADGLPAGSQALRELAGHPAFSGWPLLVLTDDAARAARSAINFLWSTFTRFDPASDLHAAAIELRHSHPAFQAPVLLDARRKPGYPEELDCDERTAEQVTRRWREYFPSGVEMGDSARAHLD